MILSRDEFLTLLCKLVSKCLSTMFDPSKYSSLTYVKDVSFQPFVKFEFVHTLPVECLER